MKKNYIISSLVFLTMLFCNLSVNAQLQAFDDIITTSISNPIGTINILDNDVLDGNPVLISQVSVVPVQDNVMSLSSNGILTYSATAPGIYELPYQVCLLASPNDCSFAIVYLTVTCPQIDAPNVSNVVAPTCQNPSGSITVDNVPLNGMLMYSIDGAVIQTVASPSNVVTIPTSTFPGNHYYNLFFAVGGCNSQSTGITVSGVGTVQLTMTGTYNDYNNNGVTDVGDIISFQYLLQNNSCADLNNLQVFAGQTAVSGGPLAVLPIGATDSTTFSSVYILTQSDISNGSVSQSSYVTIENGIGYQAFVNVPLNISDGIRFVAFGDANGNGVKDTGETDFTYGQFNYVLNNDGVIHYLTSTLSPTLYETNPATSYDLSYSVEGTYAPYYSVTASYNDITVANGSGITTYYFPITSIPYTDLSVHLFSYQAPRPGFIYTNYLYFTNSGNQPIASGTITFTKDNALTISNVTPAATVTTPDGFTFDFTNLQPNETRSLTISMPVPVIPTVTLGQLVTNSASATIPAGDVDTTNNTSILTRTIVGSYDPNEKSESHGSKILYSSFGTDDYLTYTVQFENTGTANAVNVQVEDLLDNQLDENSVRMLRASHPYTLERVGSSLTWTFAGIDLPPSVESTTIGHGYVVFQVKPKSGYAIGDIIPNTANIYFDFNPAIVTNTCTTEFVSTLSAKEFAFDNFQYYPNPVKTALTISNDQPIEKVIITSILGQIVLETVQNNLKADIDLSSFPTGIYLVKVLSGSQQKQMKIIRQ